MRRDTALALALGAAVLAATHSFDRAFTDASWRPATLAAATLALTVAALCRRAVLSTRVTLGISTAGLAAFTLLVHAPAGAGAAGWSDLADLLLRGLVQFRDEPAPAPALDGLMLLATTGTWLATHAAHELLVRAGRTMAALLVVTVLWAVPLSVPLPPGPTWPHVLPFAGATGLLLMIDRPVGRSRGTGARRPQPAGAVLGVAAVTVAALAPAVLPGYGAGAWLDLTAAGASRGYQPIVDVGDRLHLPEPRDVLRVHADRRLYLRLAGLDTFDGTTWRLGPAGESTFRPPPEALHPATRDLPAEVPIASPERVQVHVEVLDLTNIYVPVPYQPLRVTGPARDRMVYSTTGGFVATAADAAQAREGRLVADVREGLRYGVVAAIPSPDAADLAAVEADPAEVARWLELPSEYPELRALTGEVLARAGASTQLDKALALQDYFAGPASDYRYSTDVPALRGSRALESFVLETRTGYCEYFATAMAVMLRTAGVPARVAVGFLGGRESGPGDFPGLRTFRVSTRDAHAWVEVLFPGHGWIRFEPTPRSDGSVQVPTRADLDPLQTRREQAEAERGPGAERQEPLPGPENLLSDDLEDQLAGPAAPASAADRDRGGPPLLPLGGAALLLVGLAALLGAAWHRPARNPGLPDRERVLEAQSDLHRRAAGYGLQRHPDETAQDVAARWVRARRTDQDTAARFAALAQQAAFGRRVPPGGGEEAERLAAALIDDLRRSVPATGRLIAPVRVPVSAAASAARRAATRMRRARTQVGAGSR